jgi:hypothetical protein
MNRPNGHCDAVSLKRGAPRSILAAGAWLMGTAVWLVVTFMFLHHALVKEKHAVNVVTGVDEIPMASGAVASLPLDPEVGEGGGRVFASFRIQQSRSKPAGFRTLRPEGAQSGITRHQRLLEPSGP